MTADFYLAEVPEPTTILGLKLLPLGLGHLVLLHRIKSAFVTQGDPTFEDLALSVFLCSQSYQNGVASFSDPSMDLFMRRWASKLTGADRILVKLGFRNPTPIDFLKKCSEFCDYLRAGSKIPNYNYHPGDFDDMDCPAVQIVKVTLMRDMHFSESEIMDRPWSKCLWDFVTLKALAGQVKLYSPETIQGAQDVAEKLARLVAEGKLSAPQ